MHDSIDIGCGKLLLFMSVTCVALTASQIALANWQYTKWGMTAEEIVAASNGSARSLIV